MTCGCASHNLATGSRPNVVLTPPPNLGIEKELISVDACIAPVVAHLWARGVATLNSCCGHGAQGPAIIFKDGLSAAEADYIRRVIAEVDPRHFKILSWVLSEV